MKYFATIILLFAFIAANSQDIILKKDGDKIKAKVTEITPEFVKYKNFDNLDGPIYSLEKNSIAEIQYANGSQEIFTKEGSPEIVKSENKKDDEFLLDNRDGKQYKIVKIGEQQWMAENLNYESNQSWCYDNNPNNCDEHGRLYTYVAAVNVCPDGWHLPTDKEWKELEEELGMQTGVDETGWRGTSPGQGRKLKIGGSSGFEAKLSGMWQLGEFVNLYEDSYYWTSTTESNKKAYIRQLSGRASIKRDVSNVDYGYSVRCIKGESVSAKASIPENDASIPFFAKKQRKYLSIGIGSGSSYGTYGARLQGRIGSKNIGYGLHFGMGTFNNEIYWHAGGKFYYRYYYLNFQFGKGGIYDFVIGPSVGFEYPLSKFLDITAGLGYGFVGDGVNQENFYDIGKGFTYDIGISFKLLK